MFKFCLKMIVNQEKLLEGKTHVKGEGGGTGCYSLAINKGRYFSLSDC